VFNIPGYDDWRADYTSHLERSERGPDDEGDEDDSDIDTPIVHEAEYSTDEDK
jgi:hypothetical protein